MLMSLDRGIQVLMPDAPNGYPYCICMYLEGETRAVIDFGAGIKAFNEIDKKSVDIGLLSHFHPDHIHSAVLFPHVWLCCGQEEEKAYSDPDIHFKLHGGDLWAMLMAGKKPPEQTAPQLKNPDIPAGPGFLRLDISATFQDGQEFDLGKGMRFQAIHLPGHSSGHYGFYFEKQGILFSADIDLTREGPWYGNGSSNVGQFIDSINKIKEINPRILATSHRRPMSKDIQRNLDTYLAILLKRERKIYDLLKQPHTIEQIAGYRLSFSKRIFPLEDFWERVYAYHHVTHLLEQGLVREIEPGRYRQV